MRQYLSNILKYDTQRDDMKEKLDHWSDSFEFSHQQYIIMATESYISSFSEDSRYTAVRSTPSFINQENETRFYFNTTIKLLY